MATDERGRFRDVADLPLYESGVRRIVAQMAKAPYHAFPTLAAARADAHGVVILEGDYGGRIYVVVPAAAVRCSERALKQLVSDLDARRRGDPEGARVFYERRRVGERVAGGLSSGVVTSGVWLNDELWPCAAEVADVLAGRRERMESLPGEDLRSEKDA